MPHDRTVTTRMNSRVVATRMQSRRHEGRGNTLEPPVEEPTVLSLDLAGAAGPFYIASW